MGAKTPPGSDAPTTDAGCVDRSRNPDAKVGQIRTWLGSSEDPLSLPRKDLKRARGFLVYVALTYIIMTPFYEAST